MHVEIDRSPLEAGESRTMVLSGHGPFTVSTECFVDDPPPPGFRDCPECGKRVIDAQKQAKVTVAAPRRWRARGGSLVISVWDVDGDTIQIRLAVLPDADSKKGGGFMTAE